MKSLRADSHHSDQCTGMSASLLSPIQAMCFDQARPMSAPSAQRTILYTWLLAIRGYKSWSENFSDLRIGVFSAPSRSIGDEPLHPPHRPLVGVPFLAGRGVIGPAARIFGRRHFDLSAVVIIHPDRPLVGVPFLAVAGGWGRGAIIFLDLDLILPRDLEVEMLTPPHRPFTGVPFLAFAGGADD
jgi:hypothetical protein